MRAPLDRLVGRLRRRVALAAWLGDWSRQATGALFAAGAVALIARALGRLDAGAAALAFLVALPTAWTAWRTARRRGLSRAGATAWIDLKTGATGLVCASGEVDDPRWAAALASRLERAPELPRLRTRQLAGPPVAACAFGLAALWVPLPEATPEPGRRLFERSLERLSEKLATLDEELTVDERTRTELESTLARIEDELADAPTESLLEALDRLDGSLADAAEDARRRAEEALAGIERASSAGGEAGAMDDGALEALAELGELGLLGDLAAAGALGELGELGDLGELGAADAELGEWLAEHPEALAELQSELRELFDGKLGRLAEAGLLGSGKPSMSASDLERFAELVEHVCDERCEKEPGGT